MKQRTGVNVTNIEAKSIRSICRFPTTRKPSASDICEARKWQTTLTHRSRLLCLRWTDCSFSSIATIRSSVQNDRRHRLWNKMWDNMDDLSYLDALRAQRENMHSQIKYLWHKSSEAQTRVQELQSRVYEMEWRKRSVLGGGCYERIRAVMWFEQPPHQFGSDRAFGLLVDLMDVDPGLHLLLTSRRNSRWCTSWSTRMVTIPQRDTDTRTACRSCHIHSVESNGTPFTDAAHGLQWHHPARQQHQARPTFQRRRSSGVWPDADDLHSGDCHRVVKWPLCILRHVGRWLGEEVRCYDRWIPWYWSVSHFGR